MPHIFISYSSENRSQVLQFALEMKEDYKLSYWIDCENILPGDRIVGKINQGLQVSEYVVLWLTRDSLNSEWVGMEWESVLSHQIVSKNSRIIPIIAEKDLSIPPLLTGLYLLDIPLEGWSAVKQKLAERIRYGYDGIYDVFFRIEKPGFPSNCMAFWHDPKFQKELEQCRTGKTGDNHDSDYEYKFNGTTLASVDSTVKMDIQVEGTGTKLWPQFGGKVNVNGTWSALCYLRADTFQKTTFIFSVYEKGGGAKLLAKRIFTIQ